MLRFTTISPTHKPGRKEEAWEKFQRDGYIAMGWLKSTNLRHKTPEEVLKLINKEKPKNLNDAKDCLNKFVFELSRGDYVAVNNVNHGLYGVGRITSDYEFKLAKHDAGSGESYYSHFRQVRWLDTRYRKAETLLKRNEQHWKPRGAMGAIFESLPPYILRLPKVQADVEALALDVLPPEPETQTQSSGQGYSTDPLVRKAVEDYAVDRAKRHYEELGFSVEIVGKPYDLRCSKRSEELFVEVKGTMTVGEEIILTPNEVSFAEKQKGTMELFVVRRVIVNRTDSGLNISGGQEQATPWVIDRKRLSARSYLYSLSSNR